MEDSASSASELPVDDSSSASELPLESVEAETYIFQKIQTYISFLSQTIDLILNIGPGVS